MSARITLAIDCSLDDVPWLIQALNTIHHGSAGELPLDETTDPPIAPEQARRLYGIALNSGFTKDQLNEDLIREFGVNSTWSLPKSKYEAACAYFSRKRLTI